jgi:hypothetical protein
MPPNWVTHLLWLTNQKHNHLIFKKKITGSFRNHILCRANLQAETQFHTTAKVQSMYVVAGQARPGHSGHFTAASGDARITDIMLVGGCPTR